MEKTQRNNPNKDNQKGGQQSGRPNEQDGKQDDKDSDQLLEDAAVSGANDTGNKSEGGKYDSGNQTNR